MELFGTLGIKSGIQPLITYSSQNNNIMKYLWHRWIFLAPIILRMDWKFIIWPNYSLWVNVLHGKPSTTSVTEMDLKECLKFVRDVGFRRFCPNRPRSMSWFWLCLSPNFGLQSVLSEFKFLFVRIYFATKDIATYSEFKFVYSMFNVSNLKFRW